MEYSQIHPWTCTNEEECRVSSISGWFVLGYSTTQRCWFHKSIPNPDFATMYLDKEKILHDKVRIFLMGIGVPFTFHEIKFLYLKESSSKIFPKWLSITEYSKMMQSRWARDCIISYLYHFGCGVKVIFLLAFSEVN